MAFAFAFLGLPRDASPRLKALQLAQVSVVALTLIASFLAAVISQKHKSFTFGLLYSLILTSFTTTYLVRKEQIAAKAGALTRQKFVRYQLFKIGAAVGLYVFGFIAFLVSVPNGKDDHMPGQQGLWINGVKVNTYQGWIIWLNIFNWLFLWAGLFYSCCMSGNKQGPIALSGDEANIAVDDGAESDEEIARRLQAQDPNWRV